MNNKPALTGSKKYKQGQFVPKNPQKYVGNLNGLVYRSSLELRYMKYFDEKPEIVYWASEEWTVNYLSPVDGKVHRYFPDFIIRVRDNVGKENTFMVEIKPFAQTQEPKTNNKKRYIQEKITYETNRAKWKAAAQFCEEHNMQFLVFTENTIKFK